MFSKSSKQCPCIEPINLPGVLVATTQLTYVKTLATQRIPYKKHFMKKIYGGVKYLKINHQRNLISKIYSTITWHPLCQVPYKRFLWKLFCGTHTQALTAWGIDTPDCKCKRVSILLKKNWAPCIEQGNSGLLALHNCLLSPDTLQTDKLSYVITFNLSC